MWFLCLKGPWLTKACNFRRALGKLLWMAQPRHDLKLFLSLIGSQQVAPTHGTEMAIKALLRFLHGDVGTYLRLPSPKYEELMIGAARHCILHSFSDASFAPYRFNGRKGIAGGVVFKNIQGKLQICFSSWQTRLGVKVVCRAPCTMEGEKRISEAKHETLDVNIHQAMLSARKEFRKMMCGGES